MKRNNLLSHSFHALVVREEEQGVFVKQIERQQTDMLPPGEVLIKVLFSSLNYKDALSAAGNRGVTRRYPHTPGIDAAGVIVESDHGTLRPGDEVLVCGYDLGMNTPGGFGQYIRVPAAWVLPRPAGLTAEQAMQIGTAGFTAALSVSALLQSGIQPADGTVLVTGASGGVGCFAVALLCRLGFTVTAATGKIVAMPFLRELGASDFLSREQASAGKERMLLRERWAGVVDTVGGQILATAIKSTKYGGIVSCCGNAASGELPVSVYPFILRGVTLKGIDSAQCPLARRKEIWELMAGKWHGAWPAAISRTVPLADIGGCIDQMLQGKIWGRVVVDLWGQK
ncbi:MAG TPA: oxidoreductase [Desulfobulbaceae bacterium]|nr:oxidoreductase [Desulfobulbaceae bacterium]